MFYQRWPESRVSFSFCWRRLTKCDSNNVNNILESRCTVPPVLTWSLFMLLPVFWRPVPSFLFHPPFLLFRLAGKEISNLAAFCRQCNYFAPSLGRLLFLGFFCRCRLLAPESLAIIEIKSSTKLSHFAPH